MHDVVLLYERSCPNIRAARENLLRAFSEAGLPPSWRELDLEAADTPIEWRSLGSPTILVDGTDVGGAALGQGAACRLYEGPSGLARSPSVESIAAALRKARVPSPSAPVRRFAATVPGIGIALLPKIACPACWPAYAAALSAVGLGFLMESRYLLPVTIALLVLASLAIAYRANTRRGYRPAIVAASAGAALVVAKFALESEMLAYAATAALAGAAIWNAWPTRTSAACPTCDPATSRKDDDDVPEAHH